MTITLQPMPAERLAVWMERADREYIEDRMRAGEAPEVAEENARRSRAATFPDGKPLTSHRICEVVADGEPVGVLWIGPRVVGSDQWWVYDVEIDEQNRRRGYARAALEAGHAMAKSLGASSIGLNVFAFNEGARALYESMGYALTSLQMATPLD